MTSSQTFAIREARAEDVPVILQMIKALAEYEKLSDAVATTEDQLRHSLFDRRAADVLLAYAGDAPAGFAVFFHNFSTFLGRPGLYLEDIFVRPEWRGRGLGKQLFARVARVAVERGCGRMEWSVLDWNEPAIGFYRKLGARPMDEWTMFRLTGDALAGAATEALS
jgi:GNAT superfamily N-acetyltransferase